MNKSLTTITLHSYVRIQRYLCLEVDPMLECFLVVQRDPQIMSIINEVILGFCRHFQTINYFTLCEGPREQ